MIGSFVKLEVIYSGPIPCMIVVNVCRGRVYLLRFFFSLEVLNRLFSLFKTWNTFLTLC